MKGVGASCGRIKKKRKKRKKRKWTPGAAQPTTNNQQPTAHLSPRLLVARRQKIQRQITPRRVQHCYMAPSSRRTSELPPSSKMDTVHAFRSKISLFNKQCTTYLRFTCGSADWRIATPDFLFRSELVDQASSAICRTSALERRPGREWRWPATREVHQLHPPPPPLPPPLLCSVWRLRCLLSSGLYGGTRCTKRP